MFPMFYALACPMCGGTLTLPDAESRVAVCEHCDRQQPIADIAGGKPGASGEDGLFLSDRACLEALPEPGRRCYLSSRRVTTFGRPQPEGHENNDADSLLRWRWNAAGQSGKMRVRRISRMEFEIQDVGGDFHIRKLKAANSTRLNGQPLSGGPGGGWRPLKTGDRIGMGLKGLELTPLEAWLCLESGESGADPACLWLRPSDARIEGSPPWAVEFLLLRSWADLGSESCPGLLPKAPGRAARLRRDRGAYWLESLDAGAGVAVGGEAVLRDRRVPLPRETDISIGDARLRWRAFPPR